MRLFGNFKTKRVGATAGTAFYWNRQWTIKYQSANATLLKTVLLSQESLDGFYIKGICEQGKVELKIMQGNLERTIVISETMNETLNLSEFKPGLIELELSLESAKNAKFVMGWRN